ncbi:MAG: hypothetical protein ACO3H6_02965, partial [Bacilli bacterium]
LAIDVRLFDETNQEMDMEQLSKDALAEERKINSSIRAYTSESLSFDEDENEMAVSENFIIEDEKGEVVTSAAKEEDEE